MEPFLVPFSLLSDYLQLIPRIGDAHRDVWRSRVGEEASIVFLDGLLLLDNCATLELIFLAGMRLGRLWELQFELDRLCRLLDWLPLGSFRPLRLLRDLVTFLMGLLLGPVEGLRLFYLPLEVESRGLHLDQNAGAHLRGQLIGAVREVFSLRSLAALVLRGRWIFHVLL